MAKRFEDLRVWQEARKLNHMIFEISALLIERRRFGLENQLTRASLSVMNNIAEGFDRGGNKEFRHFLIQAKGSNGEMKSMLYVLLDQGLIDTSRFNQLYEDHDRMGRGLHRLIQHVGGSDFDGYSRRASELSETGPDYETSLEPEHLNPLWPGDTPSGNADNRQINFKPGTENREPRTEN